MSWDEVGFSTYDTTHMDGVDFPIKDATDFKGAITPGQYKVTITSLVKAEDGDDLTAKVTVGFAVSEGGSIEGGSDDEQQGEES